MEELKSYFFECNRIEASWNLSIPRAFYPKDIYEGSIGLAYNKMPDVLDPIIEHLDSSYNKDTDEFTFIYSSRGGWGNNQIDKLTIKLAPEVKYIIYVSDSKIKIEVQK